jgi:hypothetical protein
MMAEQENTMAEESEPVLLTSDKSDVYVLPNPAAGNAFLAVPGIFGVPQDGAKIWIRNVSGKEVDVTFRAPIGNGTPVRIPRGQPKQFDLPAAPEGVYEYSVDVDLGGGIKVPAQGGSNPRIVYG